MLLKTSVHTIFLLIGPTECGKSTFVENVLVPGLTLEDPLKNFKSNVQVISSDQIRRDILGCSYDKHDAIMLEASAQAFNLLEKRLEAVTTFPIHAEFVIIDTKGLSEEFRKQICEIAKKNQYNVDAVVFDYKKSQDYYVEGTKNKTLVSSDVRRLRTDVITNLRKSGFNNIHRIKAKNFLDEQGNASSEYKVEIDNIDLYMKTILPANQECFVVGDLHEELDAFKQLLEKRGFIISDDLILPTQKTIDTMIVLVGDLIDKGNRTAETIRFIHANKGIIRMVKGNHENFVYKYLKGMLSDVNIPEGLIENHFTSIKILEKDEELRIQFFELVDESVEHFKQIGIWNNSLYITHAPCSNKYLGKIDAVSLKEQRNFKLDREKDVQEQLRFVEKEAVGNHPFHLFGHVASAKGFRLKNKLGIDTGAVYGNKLTGASIFKGKVFLKSVSINSEMKHELPHLFERSQRSVSLMELNDDDRKRLNFVLRNKINFISGTISPADKNEETGELESLAKGLDYFRSRGVKRVSMQPKYMGSRCTIYLGRTPEESYAVSRNGYKIKNVELSAVYEEMLDKYLPMMEEKELSMMIIDGELMPWMALGKGLIEGQFKVIDTALNEEISFLQQHGFESQLLSLNGDYNHSDFSKEQFTLNKTDLIEKYGSAVYNRFKNVRDVMNVYNPLAEHEHAYKLYHEQIELFGADADIKFKPFSILKSILLNGEEILPTESKSEVFEMISDDEHLVIDFNDRNFFEKANAFYNTLTTDRKMEGVVLKPEFDAEGIAPCIKVRNPQYLRIIYGYDYTFPRKFEKLFTQKSISKKLSTSINEYELGKKMIAVQMKDISNSNVEYQQIVANMLFETSKESIIDPRL
jgi:predicted kinase/calcineurin-like phosphoesterase family protein